MKNMHESPDRQRADLGGAGIPDLEAMGAKMSAGADCDQIPGAQGPFGSPSNPIPVNGPIGERKYLAKLRGQTGQPVMFHRKGSNFSPVVKTPVDTFEVVCLDGTQWSELTFSPYHPRRSNLAPEGFTLTPTDPRTGEDPVEAHGTTFFVFNFPQALPETLRADFEGETGKRLAREVEAALSRAKFQRPEPKMPSQKELEEMLSQLPRRKPIDPEKVLREWLAGVGLKAEVFMDGQVGDQPVQHRIYWNPDRKLAFCSFSGEHDYQIGLSEDGEVFELEDIDGLPEVCDLVGQAKTAEQLDAALREKLMTSERQIPPWRLKT